MARCLPAAACERPYVVRGPASRRCRVLSTRAPFEWTYALIFICFAHVTLSAGAESFLVLFPLLFS